MSKLTGMRNIGRELSRKPASVSIASPKEVKRELKSFSDCLKQAKTSNK